MTTRAEKFAGLSVAIVTPFRDGQVDYARLREQIDFQAEAGVTCICPVGTTGESPTLTHDEHQRVIAESIEAAAGRMLVMPGTGSNATAEALRLTRYAANSGADAALVVCPYYNRPTQQGIYEHFRALAESVDIPICVYNIPTRTGRNIEPETILRLAELPGIGMVKEATGSMDQASQILSSTNLTVLSGDDSMTLPLLSIGARGVISVVGNLVPADMRQLIEAFEAGDLATARSFHNRLFTLCRDLLGLASNPIPIKRALAMVGRDTGEVRLPLVSLEAPLADKLQKVLRAYGLELQKSLA
ncbi:MAG: 4-hydroxy-tetrahydrodipicolinate synthase [Planctomycetia bacterium]|nr:4-hydroxy-tetrahydrodipicolinate synthase [Planctomycetia bacterium]RLT12750.1 MAG: 4-hydroxy-tetrahydrodipicolinate synthase [Planctomycetota bacterium]